MRSPTGLLRWPITAEGYDPRFVGVVERHAEGTQIRWHGSGSVVIVSLTQGFGLERVTGIEPALSAWEAEVLPLNYTRTARQTGPSGEDTTGRWSG
jgi:hypothetical protein